MEVDSCVLGGLLLYSSSRLPQLLPCSDCRNV